MDLDFM